jgi:predicted permease
MIWLRNIYHRVIGLFYKSAIERDMDDEMLFHIRMRAQQYIDAGMQPDEATRKARKQFGNLGLIKEKGRSVKGGGLMEEFLRDLRYAARTFSKNMGFTAVAVVTLALGIGANTAIFSVVNSVLLKPLPYPEPDRIVRAYWKWGDGETESVTATQYDFWKDARSFELTAAYAGSGGGYNLLGGSQPLRVTGESVSEPFFRVLGINPALGRTFTKEEDSRNGPCAAIISDGLWRRNFGADPAALGKSVSLNGQPCPIVGILPAGFQYEEPIDVFTPLRIRVDPRDKGHNSDMVARLKPGIPLSQAQAEMDAMLPQFRAQFPNHIGLKERGIRLLTLRDSLVDDVRQNLLLMFGAVAFVLLIACANVANLLLARAAARRGEMAVKIALGAGRARLIRQLMTENLLLALIGSALGIVLASWGVPLLLAISPDSLPRSTEVRLDGKAVLFALAAAVFTSILFGVWPALQASRLDVGNTLKSASGRSSGSRFGAGGRGLLMITEVALSVVLLAGAALLIRSFVKLNSVDLGFNPANLTAMQISLNSSKYLTTASVVDLENRINEKISALPGVQSVATVPGLPLERGLNNYVYLAGGDPEHGHSVDVRAITRDYFQTMGISVVNGRSFTAAEIESTDANYIVINERMAKLFWSNKNPVGEQLTTGNNNSEVIGVVRNIKERSLEASVIPTFYIPASHLSDGMTVASNGWFPTSWLIRTSGSAELGTALRSIVKEADPTLPISSIRPMNQVISNSVKDKRFLMILMAAFAALALLLTTVGLFGVISYQISQRTQEIGIRVALGATTASILKLVVGRGMTLTLIGMAVGLLSAYWLTKLMTDLLFGITPTDPLTFVMIEGLLFVVGLAACLIPARRAVKVDPLVALRAE